MYKTVDLSLPIQQHWRWYAGTFLTGSHEIGDTFRKSNLVMAVHGFTHVDAPAHFVPGAKTIDELALDAYCGPAAIIDLSDVKAEEAIVAETLQSRANHLLPGDIAVLRTDWTTRADWRSMDFMVTAPYLTEEACRWLLQRDVKAVGMDFPGDYLLRYDVRDRARVWRREDNTTHQILLANGVGLIEYLTNLGALTQERVLLFALPLKIAGSDGSPVRAVAVEGLQV